ncbi:MAG: PIN domain-containing protein [Bryobacteraceae bacterium]
MATAKVTITLENNPLEEIRALVAAGAAASVSAFLKHAAGVALFDAAGWKEMLKDALRQTGGPLTKKERTWADALLSPHGQKRVSRKGRRRERHHSRRWRADRARSKRPPRAHTLIARATERGMPITIPATVLAQAIRNPARQARLARLIRQAGTDLIPLDGPDAAAAGLLLARTATADIVDAHVVICARRAGQAVVTSDADDLREIAPELRLAVV